ncbi:alpha-L-fucosidase [Niabella ginsengisoli]|uniref:alpha-L-fucosidase n=1 Tax=Niabella ginsengisoli TaxID=522298 RepID=A0ABS9SNL4_9BACT|nr:alpha-L-fucosidase [Niabella ginsengisoli]MCH5599964.1 alpha-L-fucosidase [Niabella ginsengisoli]
MFRKFTVLLCGMVITCATNAQTKGILTPKSTYPVLPTDSKEQIIIKAAHVVPTANQYDALKNEYIAFIHFGPNTFTTKEWGSGMEDPKVFDLKTLDTDQWCRVMKDAGMKMVVFTAKHHDGFVLWQSRYTKHGVMSTGFQDGKGDVVKELAASCKKYGLKLGIYLSPADLYQIESPEGLYGNLSKYTERTIPRKVAGRPFANKTTFKFKVDDYNEYFLNQLFELLTEYGEISEVWFDGAHPKTKGGQKYNYIAWKKLIRTLAPKAVIFGKNDIRWAGNEAGATRNTEWNTIAYPFNPDTANYFPDLTGKSLGSREELMDAKFIHYQPKPILLFEQVGFTEMIQNKTCAVPMIFLIFMKEALAAILSFF